MILDELAAYASFRVAEANEKPAAFQKEIFGLSMLFVTQKYPLSVK